MMFPAAGPALRAAGRIRPPRSGFRGSVPSRVLG